MNHDAINDWMWLVQTNKGDFFITASGKWTQGVAAENVHFTFKSLGLEVIGMIPRKRSTGPDDMQCTITDRLEHKSPLGFTLLAGERLWKICGRYAEYQAEKILFEKG